MFQCQRARAARGARLCYHAPMPIRSPVAIVLAVAVACAPKPGAETLDGGSTSGEATGGDTGEPTGGPTDGWVPPLDCENPGEWSRKFGGPTNDTVQGLAVDAAGNIYVGLDLRNLGESAPVQFGGFEIVPGELSNIVVLKLSSCGEVLWAKQFGGPGDQYMWTLTACGDGVVFQAEAEPGTLDLGDGPISERVFFAALDGAGGLRWTHPVPTSSPEAWLLVADMVCDAEGRLAMTGSHEYGSVDLGGGPLDKDDGFVARFAADGTFLWSRDFGSPSRGFGVAYTPTGDVVVTADVDDTVDLGGGPLGPDAGGVLLAKLDGTGAHVWSERLGGSGINGPSALAVDSQGRITVGGVFIDEISLGDQTYTNVFPESVPEVDGTLRDGFLVTTDPDGVLQWSLHLGSMYDDDVTQLAYDKNDVLIVSGLVDSVFAVRAFVDAQPTWKWSASGLYQVYAELSGDDAVVLMPWIGYGAAFGDPYDDDPNSDVWVAAILR